MLLQEALHRAIIENADDDTSRLVYADWLEENGDPTRAEFIRVQCALAKRSPGDPDYIDLCERQAELGALLSSRDFTHEMPLKVEYKLGFPDLDWFQRGFLDRIDDFWFERLAADLPRVLTTTPHRRLRLAYTTGEQLSRLLAMPEATHLSGLELIPTTTRDSADSLVAAVAPSPVVHSLQELRVLGDLKATGVEALAKAPFARLAAFAVCGLPSPKRLLQAPWFQRLRSFRFAGNRRSALGWIKDLAALPDLHTLSIYYHPNTAILAFPRAGSFTALAHLDLLGVDYTDEITRALAETRMPRLAVLELGGMLDGRRLAILAGSGLFANLRHLSFHDQGIGEVGLRAVAGSPCAGELRILEIANPSFGPKELAFLASCGAFRKLTTLSLRSPYGLTVKASVEEVADCLAHLQLPRLRHLHLENWPVGDAGAKATAANPAFANLTRLSLRDCRIEEAGAAALFASPHLQHLVELDLWGNQIGRAAEALCDPTVLPNLGRCALPGSDVGEALGSRLRALRPVVRVT
jgi:uncharacterized protein (TIGR02996 family)